MLTTRTKEPISGSTDPPTSIATPILTPVGSKDNHHSVVPPLAEKSSPTPSYLTPAAVSSSRSVVTPTPRTSPLQLTTKPLPSELTDTSPTVRPSFFSGIFDSPEPVNPPVPVEEQHPVPVPTEPKPELPRSPVNPNPEEDPADRNPNNPEDSDPEPSDQEEEGDMSDNNSGAVNKPNQFEGDKGKSKEFLDKLYLYFAGNSKKIQTDKDKVQCSLSYIERPAQFFVHTIITDVEEPISDSKDAPLKGLPSWAQFKKSFIQTFRVEDDTQAALNEISKCTWASRLNELGQIQELQHLIPPALLIKIAAQLLLPVTTVGYLNSVQSICQSMIDIFGDKPLFMPSTNHSFGRNKAIESYNTSTQEKDETKDSSNKEGIAEEYIQAIPSKKDF
ncbi:uncharacterized protein FIBRA_09296 [Fibroporia radiculosa]|uniref:Uncharacterized protein n=1 Tax=Fibroporia radiculosa TaxID=599839 RepID=J7SC92_9APHY|nr:uncharacterized protein FIBRA_09296 [Fibroporia radiculosa]CCM06981.1 predicted protein [Fibroporia radiculosa]